MNIKDREIEQHIRTLLKTSKKLTLTDSDKYVIFSDCHIGNRKSRDDFYRNGEMFIQILKDFYLPEGYTLILNGDIEELQKFRYSLIRERWKDFYETVMEFKKKDRLIKLIGNHDLELQAHKKEGINDGLIEALRFGYKKNTIFIIHGHQANTVFTRFNWIIGSALKYIATPLHIKNRTAAHDSRRKYLVERRMYHFSKNRGIVSILGHTHRPLFESHNKRDTLRFNIEKIVDIYPTLPGKKQQAARDMLDTLRRELESLSKQDKKTRKTPNFYDNQEILLPCLFNSGSTIGRRGITGIELDQGRIILVHWFDNNRKTKAYWENDTIYNLKDSSFSKRIINQDSLKNVFNRIELLGPGRPFDWDPGSKPLRPWHIRRMIRSILDRYTNKLEQE